MSTFLCLGDVHAPFINKKTFLKVLSFVDTLKKKPDYIIQIGDLYDFYSASRFPKNPNITTPEQEVLDGRACAEEMWRSLKKRAPRAECYQLLGNHSMRPNKKLMELAPELFSYFIPKPLWDFPGVHTIRDIRTELILEGIAFQHGHRSKPGDHAAYNGISTVVGHSHKGSVTFLPQISKELIWELNCGYLADPSHEALKYTPQKFNKWLHGIGYIDELGPRFIPL